MNSKFWWVEVLAASNSQREITGAAHGRAPVRSIGLLPLPSHARSNPQQDNAASKHPIRKASLLGPTRKMLSHAPDSLICRRLQESEIAKSSVCSEYTGKEAYETQDATKSRTHCC